MKPRTRFLLICRASVLTNPYIGLDHLREWCNRTSNIVAIINIYTSILYTIRRDVFICEYFFFIFPVCTFYIIGVLHNHY